MEGLKEQNSLIEALRKQLKNKKEDKKRTTHLFSLLPMRSDGNRCKPFAASKKEKSIIKK